jgi:hypothetical protein
MRNKTTPRARKQKQVPAKSTKGLTIKTHTPRSDGDEFALDDRSQRTPLRSTARLTRRTPKSGRVSAGRGYSWTACASVASHR